MMILIFNAKDKSFHMSSNRINKFYLNNDDFIIKEVSEFDEDYNYILVENEVVKGDKIVLSDEEIAEVEAAAVATAHYTPRMLAFPSIGEQLDKLFHDIDEGKLDKTGEFYKAIKDVKDTFPKS